jgi:hypothetical protein
MKDDTCYRCKQGLKPWNNAELPSAYCAEHAHLGTPDHGHEEIKGKLMSWCAACKWMFSTPRNFDSHQQLKNGALICKDPRKMRRASDNRRLLVLGERGWAKNPELQDFDSFTRKDRE